MRSVPLSQVLLLLRTYPLPLLHLVVHDELGVLVKHRVLTPGQWGGGVKVRLEVVWGRVLYPVCLLDHLTNVHCITMVEEVLQG